MQHETNTDAAAPERWAAERLPRVQDVRAAGRHRPSRRGATSIRHDTGGRRSPPASNARRHGNRRGARSSALATCARERQHAGRISGPCGLTAGVHYNTSKIMLPNGAFRLPVNSGSVVGNN